MKHFKKILIGLAGIGVLVGGYYAKPHLIEPTILPNPKLTPGKLIDNLNIDETICNPNWRTGTIRPPSNYTTQLKIKQIKEYGYADKNPSHYEEDHLCSLTNGGDPTSPLNLWPESYLTSPEARDKDKVELKIHKLICDRKITPELACQEIAQDWTKFLDNNLGSIQLEDLDDSE